MNSLREACLPKLLCEIAAKPTNTITDKEQNLMELIRYNATFFHCNLFARCFVWRKNSCVMFSAWTLNTVRMLLLFGFGNR